MKGKGAVLLSADSPAEGRICIRIEDTDPGIPDSHRSKIFAPCFTTKSSGSGPGLFVVRSVLRRLGGDIRLDASTTQGATFLPSPPDSSPSPGSFPNHLSIIA